MRPDACTVDTVYATDTQMRLSGAFGELTPVDVHQRVGRLDGFVQAEERMGGTKGGGVDSGLHITMPSKSVTSRWQAAIWELLGGQVGH